jgi:hypothetical protein
MEMLTKLTTDQLAIRAMEIAEAALTKIVVIDERLDEANQRKRYSDDLPAVTYKTLFHWKGVDLAGSEYSQEKIPEPNILYSRIPAGVYDFALIHRGILDKLRDAHETSVLEVCQEIQSRLRRQLIVHSGRMSMHELPKGVKFLPLSAVVAWFDQNYSKVQIVDELNLLRKVG